MAVATGPFGLQHSSAFSRVAIAALSAAAIHIEFRSLGVVLQLVLKLGLKQLLQH